jgi:predicted lipoprotein
LSARSRRDFLAELGALVVSSAGAACSRRGDRAAVLRALVLEVMAPNVRALAGATRQLDAAIRGGKKLEDARSTFQHALLAWKRASVFRSGPLVQSNALLRAAFWPARTPAIDEVLAATRAIDERVIEELGADVKGLFGLEYLLFAAANGGDSEQRARYAKSVCANVVGYAERAARLLGDGERFAHEFAGAGQESVNVLVAQLVETIEALVGRIERVMRLDAAGVLRAADVEGYFSASSLEIASELVKGTEQLYLGAGGGGLSDLVLQIVPPLDLRLKAAFVEAAKQLGSVGGPFERVVKYDRPALVEASAALRSLERTMKIELRSALGVTLTFPSLDGD